MKQGEIVSNRPVDFVPSFNELFVVILVFVLPFPRSLSNIALALMAVPLVVGAIQRKDTFRFRIHWFLPLLFFYYVISLTLSGAPWPQFEKLLVLLVVPLIFGVQSFFFKPLAKDKIYTGFIMGNLVAALICLTRAILLSTKFNNGQWDFNPKIGGGVDYDFLTSSVMGGNYFFGPDFSFILHPSYFGLFIVFAQYLVFFLGIQKERIARGYCFVLAYFFFTCILFLLSSKSAIISSLILTLCIAIYFNTRWATSPIKKVLAISSFVCLTVVFVLFNPRLQVLNNTLSISQFTEINPNAQFGHDLRILSWDASLEVIKHNLFFGVGEGNKAEALQAVYQQKAYVVPARENFNSHNQYLDFLIGGGLVGLFFYLTGLFFLGRKSIKESNFPLLAFLLIFSFNALFENLLSRYWGLLFFSVFISLLSVKDSNDQSKR
jgi:O-antigen ligase